MGSINIDKLTELRSKVIKYYQDNFIFNKETVTNEEQTKTWFIIPFLRALGYDDESTDVVPEVTADFSKKGEKVDYMLQVDNLPVALIECKKFGEPLDKHINQLYRYFQAKNVHIGILTNGIVYYFFTDSKRENVMDKKPYLEFDITTDDLELLNDYTRDNILQAPIPSIVNKRKQLEQQKEQEISDYKYQINELQDKLSKQKEEPNVNEQIYSAMFFQQLLKSEKLEKENKQLKEKTKPKKEKVFYGHTDLDKQKVPADIARDMVALLPEEVFVPEAKFFDPFCRYGELLMAVKDRLMQSQAMIKAFPDEDDRDDYISDNQLYAFVIDEKGLKNVTRVIHKTSNPRESHVVCFGSEDVYKKAMKSDSKIFIVEKLKELGQMKFDVVIGNPPYNNDIYLDFVQLGHALSTKCSIFITPAKWQAKGGTKNEQFRKEIVPYMKEIVYYPREKDAFDISAMSGVTYFSVDKQVHNIKTIKNICSRRSEFNTSVDREISDVLNNALISITDKVRNVKHIKINSSRTFFYRANQSTHGTVDRHDAIVMAGSSDGSKQIFKYATASDLNNASQIEKYKAIMSFKVSSFNELEQDGRLIVLRPVKKYLPREVCKDDFLVLRLSDSEAEIDSFISYMNTKFVSFLVLCGNVGMNLSNEESWRFVPAPETFDHIFTDQELYDKYGLTDEEINIIESVIKERK